MAFVAPFRGLRFNPAKIENMEDVVTPPYDVVDEKKQAAFMARNQYNMINLDISKEPGPSEDTAERYVRARNLFEQWQAEEVIVRDEKPAIYLYYTEYTLPSGKRFTRKGLVALVRLSEFSEGIVKPHEEIFETVAADRLRLMDTTQAQFSQIFSLYSDKDGRIIEALEASRADAPLCRVKDPDGARHSIWAVTNPETLAAVQSHFKDKSVYIADGHHRYTTALNYRRMMIKKGGPLENGSPFNQTMMYLCPMEDPGLSVLPTHRLVRLPHDMFTAPPTLDQLTDMLSSGFELEEIRPGSRESLIDEALTRMSEEKGKGSMFGLYHAGEDRCFVLTMQEAAKRNWPVVARAAALQELDVVVLSDLVLDHHLGLKFERCEAENLVRYFSDPDEALDVAVKESVNDHQATPLLFLMNNTQVEQVMRVADEKLIMPHKSTYFYPKVLTGLIMNKFLADEQTGG